MLARFWIFGLAGLLGAQDPAGISAKEAALGARLSEEARKLTSPLADPVVQQYVAALGQRLARHAARRDLPWEFTVIHEDTGGSTREPLVFPGGKIFICASLILAAENEAELAGVLAHAITHVAERHGIHMAGRSTIDSGQVPLVFAGAGARVGVPADDDRAFIPLGLIPTQCEAELAADRGGVTMLSAAGYQPAALLRYISRTQRDLSPGKTARSMLPPRQERIAALQSAIAVLPAGGVDDGAKFASTRTRVRELSSRYEARPPRDTPPTLRRSEKP